MVTCNPLRMASPGAGVGINSGMPPPNFAVPSATTLRQARRLLHWWLRPRVPAAPLAWLEQACRETPEGPDRQFFMNFSAACRHFDGKPLNLTAHDESQAERVRTGWSPALWTEEQAARTAILLHRDPRNAERWLREVRTLFEHADLGEQVALYQALPLLPHPEALVERCAEGVRSNVVDVFQAVAHRNPYPSEYLPEPAWNQMVLKALFVEVLLAPIQGLDERANPTLARMLCDYAHERWAAKRPVSPELWRCVGPHADARGVEDLERAWVEGDGATREAAADALRRCPWPEADYALQRHGLHREGETL